MSEALAQVRDILKVIPVAGDQEMGSEIEASEQVSCPASFDLDEVDDKGLRVLDILCRGRDSEDASLAVMFLIQAGADAFEQPCPSEAAPLHSAAYQGNPQVLCTLLDMGVDAKSLSNGIAQKLLGSNAIHALATGFRSSRADAYAECFGALLGAGCNVDAKDRKRQTAIDIAMRTAATTGDETLTDAMLEFGVQVDGSSQLSANSVGVAISQRTGDFSLISKISGSAFENIARSVDALKSLEQISTPHPPLPSELTAQQPTRFGAGC